MQQVFEREFRREKNLEVAKKAAERGPKGKAEKSGKDKVAERLEAQLKDIEDKFFEQFPVEDEEKFGDAKPEDGAAKAEWTAWALI